MPKLIWVINRRVAPEWFARLLGPHVDWEFYDPDQDYDHGEVFYYDMYGPHTDEIPEQLAQGRRIIYDCKNEHYLQHERKYILDAMQAHPGQAAILISGHAPLHIPGVEVISTPYWYWIIDQFNWRNLKYHKLTLVHDPKYKFLMTINLQRRERDAIWEAMQQFGRQIHASYRGRGYVLHNDPCDLGEHNWQRMWNTDWYRDTAASIVVESYVDDSMTTGITLNQQDHWFVCEKSFKPVIMNHPYIIYSRRESMAYMQHLGFETWPELWDESWDNHPVWQRRLDGIVDAVRSFDPAAVQQPRVQEKLRHNRERFFDTALTQQFFENTVLDPVKKFIDAS